MDRDHRPQVLRIETDAVNGRAFGLLFSAHAAIAGIIHADAVTPRIGQGQLAERAAFIAAQFEDGPVGESQQSSCTS